MIHNNQNEKSTKRLLFRTFQNDWVKHHYQYPHHHLPIHEHQLKTYRQSSRLGCNICLKIWSILTLFGNSALLKTEWWKDHLIIISSTSKIKFWQHTIYIMHMWLTCYKIERNRVPVPVDLLSSLLLTSTIRGIQTLELSKRKSCSPRTSVELKSVYLR